MDASNPGNEGAESICNDIRTLIPELEILIGTFLYKGKTWSRDATIFALDHVCRHIQNILNNPINKGKAQKLETALNALDIRLGEFTNKIREGIEEVEAKRKLIGILENFKSDLLETGYYGRVNIGELHKIVRELKTY